MASRGHSLKWSQINSQDFLSCIAYVIISYLHNIKMKKIYYVILQKIFECKLNSFLNY